MILKSHALHQIAHIMHACRTTGWSTLFLLHKRAQQFLKSKAAAPLL
jgi:N-acetylglutamate synthase-like GNAT family acetyltransferase